MLLSPEPARLSDLIGAGAPTGAVQFGRDRPIPVEPLIGAGAALHQHGHQLVTALILTNDQTSVELLLGAIAAGVTVVSLPLPSSGAGLGEYISFLREACSKHGVGEIIVRDDIASLLAGSDVTIRPHSSLDSSSVGSPGLGGFQLVQYTSGTTGEPRGILLSDRDLGANVTAILHALQPAPGDSACSWLPISHDMGLIGMLFTTLAASAPAWTGRTQLQLIEPGEFLRRPSSWLTALSASKASFTAAPDFGYRLALMRSVAAIDLSAMRCAIIGGEVVRDSTLRSLVTNLGAYGLTEHALCPAYGMAEVGLAVTMTGPSELARRRTVHTADLADGRVVDVPADSAFAHVAVASGPPLAGYGVTTSEGNSRTGVISVRGPSIGRRAESGTELALGGVLKTGDVGFVDGDGWLYVNGRVDEVIVLRGRNLSARVIELAVSDVTGVRAGRAAITTLPTGESIVLAEQGRRSGEPDDLVRDIERAVLSVAGSRPDRVFVVPKGTLPMTSSGKLRRTRLLATVTRLLQ
ncbi:MAG: AMP-binding protein [Actinomycetota bacterium]|nr:AMP-binding protein [Actinomycetota bacterium]